MGQSAKRRKVECQYCKEAFDTRGISWHERSCKRQKQVEQERLVLQTLGDRDLGLEELENHTASGPLRFNNTTQASNTAQTDCPQTQQEETEETQE
ncbi:hypothetical protein K435DRAFT_870259 [Dendrothele bispora CBS 962.96]|uniref:C2H2-type domain-containing protein n=1 Tax=Dendrothele bispora (strain CBS 962.96) TaxID=1314807 RepID=A0A4S8L700_DENBC|nr:hypothetical protein K435DRAFT_870259 [Dendrothele bispora CBS 962.96]